MLDAAGKPLPLPCKSETKKQEITENQNYFARGNYGADPKQTATAHDFLDSA